MKTAATQWAAIGTLARVVVTSPSDLGAAQRTVIEELRALDQACSRFRPDSEIIALTRRAGQWAPISGLLAEVLECALAAARDSDGDVDPTMGTDLSRLGYDRDFGEILHLAPVPDESALAPLGYRLVHRPTWRDVELDRARHRVRVPAGVLIDVGAIAKAWCADRCARRINDEISTGVLVSLGGDVATAGRGPEGGWRVRVQDRPDADRLATDEGSSTTVVLNDGFAVATSSTVSRSWRRGASRLHHILDPTTRRPAEPVWRTATVAAASCVEANTASTASVVRGLAAPAWLASRRLTARLVDRHGFVHTIGGWPTQRVAS